MRRHPSNNSQGGQQLLPPSPQPMDYTGYVPVQPINANDTVPLLNGDAPAKSAGYGGALVVLVLLIGVGGIVLGAVGLAIGLSRSSTNTFSAVYVPEPCGPTTFDVVPGSGVSDTGPIHHFPQAMKDAIKFNACLRKNLAKQDTTRPIYWQNNNDINDIPDFRGVFTKGLQHDAEGNVIPASMQLLLDTINGNKDAMQNLPIPTLGMGEAYFPFVDPNAIYDSELFGRHASSWPIPLAPKYLSDETAGEMVEAYCASLMRDIKFSDYGSSSIVSDCCGYLNALNVFKGPRVGGLVTPATILQTTLRPNGDVLPGPRFSQFLYYDVPVQAIGGNGVQPSPGPGEIPGFRGMPQSNWWSKAGEDFNWAPNGVFASTSAIKMQNGIITEFRTPANTSEPLTYRCTARHLATNQDLDSRQFFSFGQYQFLLGIAGAIKQSEAPNSPPFTNPSNPFFNGYIRPRISLANYGFSDILHVIGRSIRQSQLASQYHKWSQMRIRAEEVAIEVHKAKTGVAPSNYNNNQLLNSGVLADIFAKQGTYFMSQTDNIGCVQEPTYPSGYTLIAAISTTVTKALIDPTDTMLAYEPSADCQTLVPVMDGPTHVRLNMCDELDKFAYNSASDRLFQGIHFRSDVMVSLKLGEDIAINYLQEHADRYANSLPSYSWAGGVQKKGFLLRKFDGTLLEINTRSVSEIEQQ